MNISLASPIFKSRLYADALYESVMRTTPHVRDGRAEFFFIANDPTPDLLRHLQDNGYPHYVNHNPVLTEAELFARGIGKPVHVHRAYRGHNECIRKAKGEIVVLLCSDIILAPNWLDNLLKRMTPSTAVASQLIERKHPKYNVFPGAHWRELGSGPNTFDQAGFEAACKALSIDAEREGGAYMPLAIHKSVAESVGMYPEGNIAGQSFGHVAQYGDAHFMAQLSAIGVRHITSMDSLAYHFKEGELDE